MRNEYNTYLSQVRSALWGESVTWPADQTEMLLMLHGRQGTGPLVYPFVLMQETLSADVRAHMKAVCMTTIQGQVPLQYTLSRAWSALQKAGLRAVLMKGAGLAALYPEPQYRTWGDIDLYVGKDQYHPACAVMRDTFPGALKFDEELDHYKHYNLIADGISIEVHRVTIDLQHPRDERYYARLEHEGMTKAASLRVGDAEVLVPEPTFNALFVFFHSWEHMMTQGANMRQLCDLALLLHHYARTIDAGQLVTWLRALCLDDVWALYAYILHHYLGLPEAETPGYKASVAPRAERLLDDLLSGRLKAVKEEKKAPKGRLKRKLYTMSVRMANARRIGQYSPAYARHMRATTLINGASRLFAKDRHWE